MFPKISRGSTDSYNLEVCYNEPKYAIDCTSPTKSGTWELQINYPSDMIVATITANIDPRKNVFGLAFNIKIIDYGRDLRFLFPAAQALRSMKDLCNFV